MLTKMDPIKQVSVLVHPTSLSVKRRSLGTTPPHVVRPLQPQRYRQLIIQNTCPFRVQIVKGNQIKPCAALAVVSLHGSPQMTLHRLHITASTCIYRAALLYISKHQCQTKQVLCVCYTLQFVAFTVDLQ